MIRGLKVVMIVWAAIAILLGLAYIFLPSQLGEMGGFEKGPAWVHYILALLGICFIVSGAFIIIAARDPLKNIRWVQFAIAVAILLVVVAAYSIMRGFVTFEQARMDIILFAVFAAALLALYPYRAAKQ